MSKSCLRHGSAIASRRDFLLQSAAFGTALLLPAMAHAGRIPDLAGEVIVNGRLANKTTEVFAGDVVKTGPDGRVVVVMGRDAFLIRANSEIELLGESRKAVLSGLRMLTGALLAVFGKGPPRVLRTSTVTAGIRGTGIYMEASAAQTYFCTCYGSVEIEDRQRRAKSIVLASYHNAKIIRAVPAGDAVIESAQQVNHSDDELAMLEQRVGRKPPFVKS